MHQTTSVWKGDLCPVEVESSEFPHGWFQLVGNDGALELDLCGHCALPIVTAHREHDAHEQRPSDSGNSTEAAIAEILTSTRHGYVSGEVHTDSDGVVRARAEVAAS